MTCEPPLSRSRLVLLALASLPALAQTISTGAIPVKPGTRLAIQASGPVSVQAIDGTANLTYRLWNWTARRPLHHRGSPGQLDIQVPPAGSLELWVPRSIGDVTIRTTVGPVLVAGITSSADVEAASGALTLAAIAGNVKARTGGGEIRLGRIGGTADCRTGAGGVTAEWLARDAALETAGGEVIVADSRGALRVASGGGNVHVCRGRRITAVTEGGSVEVERADGMVSARTLGGAIRLGAISGPVQASTVMGSILAGLLWQAAAREASQLDTKSGDITVILPSNMAVTVQAENEFAGRTGRIFSDFPEVEVLGWGWLAGRPAAARGDINGGGPLLKLSASRGMIRLQRQDGRTLR